MDENPELRWIFGSYSQDFAARDSVRTRRLIESHWYRERFGDRYELLPDQNTKLRFENTKTGVRLATSIGGRATREASDIIILDDPHKASDAYSPTQLENVQQWYSGTVATRLNDQRTGAIMLVCQRLHQSDLPGVLLETGEWTHVCLPAEYEPNHPYRYASDPRTVPGEPLWPDQDRRRRSFTAMKRSMSAFDVAGQLQQRPSPGGGGVFEIGWWKWFDPEQPPRFDEIVTAWDLAFSDGLRADYSVGQVWGIRGEDRYLLHSVRDRFSFPEMLKAVEDLTTWVRTHFPRHKHPATFIERAANADALAQTLRDKFPH